MDTLIHGTAADGTIRCMATITTEIVREATRRHQTSPLVSVAFGRTLTGTLLLGSSLKQFDRLTVKLEGNGDVGNIITEANAAGKVRGYVRNPTAEAESVNRLVGSGMFYVMRESGFDVGSYSEPYQGSVPIVSGEIAEDFAYYLAKSEQIPSAVLLGVSLQNDEPFVASAGGVMLQMMPDANEHIITMLEDSISYAPKVTELIKSGATPTELLETILGVIDFQVLEEKPVGFACTCSLERAKTLIGMIEKAELEEMLLQDKGATMSCHFCNENYVLDEEMLRELVSAKN
jgi:molecular chaperone Hsp33